MGKERGAEGVINVLDWLEKPVRRNPAVGTYAPSSFEPTLAREDAATLVSPVRSKGPLSHEASYALQVPAMLQPQTTVPEYFMSNFEKARLVQHGISKASFEHFKQQAALDYFQCADLLSVARNTLLNKKGNDTYSLDISEKLVALAEVYTHGIAVFGALATLRQWLAAPNAALGGVTPFSLLHTQYGRKEVDAALGRIEWGVYA